jgi:hypothetical protein
MTVDKDFARGERLYLNPSAFQPQQSWSDGQAHNSDLGSLQPKKEENWLTLRDKKRKQKPKTFKPLPAHLQSPEAIKAYINRFPATPKPIEAKPAEARWKPEPEPSKPPAATPQKSEPSLGAATNLTPETSLQPKAPAPQKIEPTLVASTSLSPGMLAKPEGTPVKQTSLKPQSSAISDKPQRQTAQVIAAAPQPQPSTQTQPQQVAQATAQPEGQWMNSGVTTKGGLETIPFDGRVIRKNKEGKQVIIPVKYGQQFQMQPGDQLQNFFNLTKFKIQEKANSPGQTASVNTFKDKLKNNAQKRLQSNYNRLDTDLKEYKNLSPNNPKWQQLRQLSQKDQQLMQLNQRLDRQISDLVIKDRKETSFTPPNAFIDRDDVYPMGVVSPQIQSQIKQIESQQQLLKIARRQMQAQYPALAVIDSAKVANSSNAQLLGTISQGFGQIQFNIKDLSQQIQKDPSKALLLDDVVKGTLQGLKIDPNNPKQSVTNKAIIDYLKWEKTKDNIIKWGGTLLTGGLTVGAIIATFATEGAALPFFLGLGGAATGLGTAAHEYRELATVDLAADAQQGGTKLTSQDKDSARFNLMMSRVNLLMAGLDVGLSVKAVTGLMKLGAKPISQFDKALELQKAGRTEEAIEISQQLKKEVDPQTFKELEKIRLEKQAKLQKLQEQRKTKEAQRQLKEGIEKAEANGRLKTLKKADREWLNADPSGRRKELAFDPDTGKFNVEEAKVALQAEKDGLLDSPLRRAIDENGRSQGGDYIDAKGKYWDVKDASAGADNIAEIATPRQGNPGENILVDCTRLSIEEQLTLEAAVKSKLNAQSAEITFVPKR